MKPDREQFLARLNAAVEVYIERMQGQRPQGTKTWIAAQLGVDRTTLYKYLDGTNRLPIDALRSLVRVLGLGDDEANALLFLGDYGVPVPVPADPLPTEPVITPATLRTALADALPEALSNALSSQLSLLTGLLNDLRTGQVTNEEVIQAIASDPAVSDLTRALAGQEVATSDLRISFGAGAQTGDIHMRDVVGRDIVRFALHTGNVYHFHHAQVFITGENPPAPTVSAESTPASVHRTVAPNPFGRVGRIDDPVDFFDREHLLERIFVELAKGINLSLVGEAQIGKSSLLAMIRYQGPDRLGLPQSQVVSLDMQLVRDEHDFFECLCDLLQVSSCRGFLLGRRLEGRRYILCLDEIEKMRKERFSGDEREELRGLADGNHAPLTLVTASRAPLAELFPDKWGNTSPLANICMPIDVPPFSAAIARRFLTTRLQTTQVTFTPEEIEGLIHESGGHPARLQRAAALLYERYVAEEA